LLVVEAQALGEMSLRVQVDQERPEPHLGQTKPIGGRDATLPCPPLKIEEELFPD